MSKQGGHIFVFVFILAIAMAGFFCSQNVRASQSIVISEAQITGGPGKTANDFIELYNPTATSFDLNGYRLVKRTKNGTSDSSIKSWTAEEFIPANGYYLWANSGYTDIGVQPNVTTSATIADDNGIALRRGSADTGEIIDSLAWGEAVNDFIEGLVFPSNPGAGESLERNFNLDTDDNSADFSKQADPNPQSSGSGSADEPLDTTPPPDQATGSSTPDSSLDQQKKYNFGDLVINELVSDPADNEVEWVELFNKASQEINLTGWWLEDGSKAKTKLTGSVGLSGSARYKIIEKPAGNLNNSGDLIILYEPGGKIIDQVVYGNWSDGYLADNAPAAGDPDSLARKFDGYNTFNNANDFSVTRRPTKGTSNLIEMENEVSSQAKAGFDFSDDIFISEVLPNPVGDDTKLEFIEIYNAGKREVNLSGWSLSNEDNKKVCLEKMATSTIIKAGEFLAFFRPKTKIVLHNDQGEVKLFKPLADQPARTMTYWDVKEGQSYNLVEYKIGLTAGQAGGEWVLSQRPTPGEANFTEEVNQAPLAEFSFPLEALIGRPVSFDSSDTIDPNDDDLKYAWDFGDGFKNSLANPEHTFFKSGIYKVQLAVSDGQATTTAEKTIKIVESADQLNNLGETDLSSTAFRQGSVIINEILPDPAGADTGQEWAEFKNQNLFTINLLNWRLENNNGKYKFKDDLWLGADDFYLLTNAASKLAFKNSSDVITLYNDLDELVDTVEYTEAVQGEAYARGQNGKWFWTTKLTPGEENIISLDGSQSIVAIDGAGAANQGGNYLEVSLDNVKDLEVGSLVKIRGLVAVEPGILGVQIFYIASSSAGIQIYNYKKDFPPLKVGDQVEINGELAKTQSEFRIKTKTQADIKITGDRVTLAAQALNCGIISEENIGQLITVSGEITDKKASTIYLDDGNGEILVYFKQSAGLTTKDLKSGQTLNLTGILSQTSTGLRLLPRYQEDIVRIDQTDELGPQVLGESSAAEAWAIAERDKKLELFKYLLIIAGGAIIILAWLLVRIKRKNVV